LKNSSGNYTVKGVPDENLYSELIFSIQVLGFQPYFDSIFKLVSAVLLLGNVQFNDDTLTDLNGCTPTNMTLINNIAVLLGLEPS
jgi:myosin heavy subunit